MPMRRSTRAVRRVANESPEMSCAFHRQPSSSTVEPSATPASSRNEANTRLLESVPVRDVVVVGPVLALERVGQIERPVVGTPARPVRADDALVHLRHAQIGVEPPEAADLQLLLVVHAAGEKTSAAIAFAVVQPRARLVGVHGLNELERGRSRSRRSRSHRPARGRRRRRGAAPARRRRGPATSVRSCLSAGPAARSTGCRRAGRSRPASTDSLPRRPTPGPRRGGSRTRARIRSSWSWARDCMLPASL